MVDSDFGDTVAALIAVHGGPYSYSDLKEYAQTVETGLRTIPAFQRSSASAIRRKRSTSARRRSGSRSIP